MNRELLDVCFEFDLSDFQDSGSDLLKCEKLWFFFGALVHKSLRLCSDVVGQDTEAWERRQ